MADQARVTSVEAIEAFRSRLIVFLAKARPTLEEVSSEVVRTRLWLQNDQRRFWEHELRIRRKKLERAESDLFSATLSRFQEAGSGQQMAVRHAREAVRDAEAKLAHLRKWDRELENRSDPLIKHVDQLHHYLATDMARAVAHLAQVIATLQAYSGVGPPDTAPEAPPGDSASVPPGGAESATAGSSQTKGGQPA